MLQPILQKVAPYVISSGHLATAMQASMTVPGALKPVKLDGKLLVDGGVVNNMPVDIAQKLGLMLLLRLIYEIVYFRKKIWKAHLILFLS